MSNKIVDMTPLLDVVLILLFALLMNMSLSQDKLSDKTANLESDLSVMRDEREQLVDEHDKQIEELNEQIKELAIDQKRLEENLKQANAQNQELAKMNAKWLTSNGVASKDFMSSQQLKDLYEADKTNKTLYQLDFVAKQFKFIEIRIDTNRFYEITIDKQETNLYFTDELMENPVLLEGLKRQLYNQLEGILVSGDGGYNMVLFTVVYDEKVFSDYFDLVWDTLKEIDLAHKDGQIYRLGYLEYSFYNRD